MDVYLVPVSGDRHELYCEVADSPEEAVAAGPSGDSHGFFRRMRDRFREMLAEAERERRQHSLHRRETSWAGRVKVRTMRWVAESIAEQRLLWHLRHESSSRLVFPDDLDAGAALNILKTQLGRDYEKHRFWMIIDALGFLASGLFMLVPGPNLIAYYFAFRVVGHYFSFRGARNGMTAIAWQPEPSPLLSELRRAIALEPELRERSVRDIATRLRLENLATFFERSAAVG